MTNGELLANHIRTGEVETRRRADKDDPCPGCKRYIAVLLEAAIHIESLPDDDSRIAQLERAGYFGEGKCKPRRWGRLYIRTECSKIGRDYAGPSQFIEGLAMAAANDEAFRKRQSAPYAFEDLGIHFIEGLDDQ